MEIQSTYDLKILIEGTDILKSKGVVLAKADIYESIMRSIPTCELEISIPINAFDYKTIVDGTQIKFQIIAKLWGINDTYPFRIYNVRRLELSQKFVMLHIEGVLDYFQGYRQVNNFNRYALSSEVFKVIAANSNLKAEIDQTNDLQLWVAGNRNTYQFFNYMTQYGYVNETSGMFWCIDRYKTLLYKNLTSLFRDRHSNVYTFVQSPTPNLKTKQFGYTSAAASIQSGTNNLKNEGYGGTDLYFDVLTYSWKEPASRKVVAESNLINISKELSQGLSQDWYPFDVGNFHSNYYNAYKQNKRVLATYSSYITVQSQFFQPYRLGQIVNFEYLDAQDKTNKLMALSGTYIIDAIHITMNPGAITANVEMVMQGLNSKGKTRDTY